MTACQVPRGGGMLSNYTRGGQCREAAEAQ